MMAIYKFAILRADTQVGEHDSPKLKQLMIELVTVRKGGADVWWQSQARLYYTKVTMGSMLNILDT